MTCSTCNNQIDRLSLLQQYASANNSSGYSAVDSATQPPVSTVDGLSALSTDYIYDPCIQYNPALLELNSTVSWAQGPFESEYTGQQVLQYDWAARNDIVKALSVDDPSPGQDSTCIPSLTPTMSTQAMSPARGHGIESAHGEETGGCRGVQKQHDYRGSLQGPLQCHWKDCKYRGTFSRKAMLMRHVETQHVTPRNFNCKICGKSFGRKDNLTEHAGRVHGERIGN